ncbi:hypothetical protein VTK73DRAFT_3899 [Phialemonium thermophilum]|uniref:ENTH domain-containing protein n=1 Tax=Phialemonium thermophilum TaxID=223376 RepID=A0ABR3WX84_9PEZI
MDFSSLKEQVSNLTLYDIKAGVRKVQNAVMNYTEMEAKVREATNNEPWGASSTLMQEIANGTFSYQTLNEIMPMIYRRFTEKSAEEWRQIYKALQLLEFLIKNGSERVIDDARSHLTLLKMLRQFHYIDQNGKDQGVNVRNRAKELTELLSDVDRIRAERKKAKANRTKYTGVEGGLGGGLSSSGRFGGFGNQSGGYGGSSTEYGGYSGGVYGDGGGFGGQSSDFRDTNRRSERFEEYDEFDDDERPAAAAATSSRSPTGARRTTTERAGVKKTVESPAKKKEPEVDLFSFDEPAPSSTTTAPALAAPSSGAAITSLAGAGDDDEFDDFQSATPANQPPAATAALPTLASPISPPISSTAAGAAFAAPQPVSAPKQANLGSMVGLSSISPTSTGGTAPSATNFSAFSTPLSTATSQPARPPGFQSTAPNYFQSVPLSGPTQQATPTGLGGPKLASPAAASSTTKPASGGDAFGALWSQASTGIKKTTTQTSGPALGQLAKEKSSASIWGAPAASSTPLAKPVASNKPATGSTGGGGLDDLLG